MLISHKIAVTLLALCSLASGCALVGEKYQRPTVPVPAAWQGGNATPTAWPDYKWWQGFQTTELNRLIEEAQNNSHDLKAAAARVTQARAVARIAGAPLYPAVTVEGDASRANVSNKSNPGSARVGMFNSYRVAPQASYELDIWGANKFASEAADDALLASIYGQEMVKLTLTADVARTYFQILSLNDLLDDAQRNLENARNALDVVEAQKAAGRLSTFEVERQRSQVASAEATIPPLLLQQRAAQNALAVLLGKAPGELTIAATSLRTLAIPEVPLGLPSELMARRPDIRQAEMNLIAANANVGAARAALFPSLTLNAVTGIAANSFGGLSRSGAGFHAISLAVLATIFDGGRLDGQLDLAKARKLELAEAYQQSIISGYRDVEDALAGIKQFSAQESGQIDAVTHARETYRIADLRLRSGATDFTAVLDAQRTLLAAETVADQARFNRFSSAIDLYRALGGGWTSPPAEGTERQSNSSAMP